VTQPVRVLVADDHIPTRAGVRLALQDNGFEVCAEAGGAAEAIEAAQRHRPDLCLLDIRMPGNGIVAAAEIKLLQPDVAIVMLTISRDDADLFESLQVGASGYLLKDTPPTRLPAALRGVLDGEAPLPRSLTARLIDEFRSRERSRALKSVLRARDVRLSQREWEVLELLGHGLVTSEIAERLDVSTATVRSHVHGILKKLRVPDRKSAVRLLQGRADLGV
jgi:DNA-binding NarL/FixJ family response regulator